MGYLITSTTYTQCLRPGRGEEFLSEGGSKTYYLFSAPRKHDTVDTTAVGEDT